MKRLLNYIKKSQMTKKGDKSSKISNNIDKTTTNDLNYGYTPSFLEEQKFGYKTCIGTVGNQNVNLGGKMYTTSIPSTSYSFTTINFGLDTPEINVCDKETFDEDYKTKTGLSVGDICIVMNDSNEEPTIYVYNNVSWVEAVQSDKLKEELKISEGKHKLNTIITKLKRLNNNSK